MSLLTSQRKSWNMRGVCGRIKALSSCQWCLLTGVSPLIREDRRRGVAIVSKITEQNYLEQGWKTVVCEGVRNWMGICVMRIESVCYRSCLLYRRDRLSVAATLLVRTILVYGSRENFSGKLMKPFQSTPASELGEALTLDLL